jgi:hypothetical protein
MSGHETKSFAGHLQIKDAARGIVEAVVCTFNVVDRDGDVISPTAIVGAVPVKGSSYGHNVVTDGAPPVSKGTVTASGNKAIYRGQYYMKTLAGRDAFAFVQEEGSDCPWSFGFPRDSIKTAAMPEPWKSQGGRRFITSLTPIEVSPVFQAAGISTGTLSAKHQMRAAPSYEQQRAVVTEIARKLKPSLVTHSEFRRFQRQFEASHARYVLDTTEVTEAQQKAARFWADRACDFMAEKRVRIVWDVDSLDVAGCFKRSEPDTIFLNPLLSLDAIAPTVLHECVHRKRHLRGLPNDERLVELDELELCELLGAA